MPIDLLTTSGINSFINSYIQTEKSKRITPLKTRQTKYNNLSSAYGSLLSNIDKLKGSLSTLKLRDSSSIFKAKKAESSNTNLISATAVSGADEGTFTIRTNQLAKNDTLLSIDRNSNSSSAITSPGTYSFTIKTGDGSGSFYISKVSVTLVESDFINGNISYSALADKIKSAIKDDKAEITSGSVSGYFASSGSFKLNLGGTETEITYSEGNYVDVIDNVVSQINNISGVTAEKIVVNGNVQLKITAVNSSKYIQLKDDTGTLLTQLGVSSNKEIAASGSISASTFSPVVGSTQFSISSKNTGYNFRIMEISDDSPNGLLNEFGINLGTTRQAFVQNENGEDTAGFVHSELSLNAKLLFNGIEIQRDSNTISDLVNGVTINLKSVFNNTDPDVVISVGTDVTSIKSKIESFINSFNELYSYLRKNSSSVSGQRGVLFGDSTTSSLLNILGSSAYQPLTGFSSNVINSLSKLGITFDVNNGLTISDSSQLESAILSRTSEVELFFNDTNGFAETLYSKVNSYSGANGYLQQAISRISSNLTQLNDSVSRIESQINKRAEVLRSQYQKLQTQLAELLSSQSLFTNYLG
ncbi:MAG: flagellar filament capping protein FliD [Ignavibacterium album]|uniref:flagellar filament capping protein FliD n=1 Tax=Ignavibacterium album TaxID=591197 RepID=UPI0026E923CA|nr:flagellar filament capping protein FliD [Ignavibacterium album]MBI5662653.1 flagellar filament capping protein FliD [Ignavibacterium album]